MISDVYKKYLSNNGELPSLHVPPQSDQPQKTKPKAPRIHAQRFKSPGFRRAVRTVLNHFGYPMTMGSFAEWSKLGNLTTTQHWYESAANIANSSLPELTTAKGGVPVSGCFIETKAGKLIEVGKCLDSVRELIDYNRRVKC